MSRREELSDGREVIKCPIGAHEDSVVLQHHRRIDADAKARMELGARFVLGYDGRSPFRSFDRTEQNWESMEIYPGL